MIADLKPYPEYRESGLPWLGRVPAHWVLSRSKRLFSARKDLALPEDVQLSATQAYGVIPQSDFEAKVGQRVVRISMHLEKRRHVEKDDFVISMRSFQGGIERAWASGAIRSSYVVLKPEPNVNIGFFAYLFKSHSYIRALQATSDFIRDGQDLNFSNFCGVDLPVVPPVEQGAIARFLDWANGRLERAIRAKRKVIALLNEQKQVIIHRAITCGLDPSAQLRSFNSRWFSRLPAHWHVLTLRRVITAAIDGPHFSPQYCDTGIPFLSARNIRPDRWILGNTKFISKQDYDEFSRRVRPELGDVLYTKGGTTGVARAVDLTFPFQVWVHVAVLKLQRGRVSPEFLAYCLNSPRCYEQAQLFTRGATNQDLGLGRMKEIELPVPPTLEAQERIVEFLNARTSAFNSAISRLEREIDLLREYRTRLVADVVTGKLDVREAVTRLPEEAAPDTAEDDTDLSADPEAIEEEAAV